MPYPYPELPRKEVVALGVRTSYVMAGLAEQPLVVLIHGMSASGDAYRETMHELASDFWLIAPDIPGFGYSDDTEPFTLPHLVEWLAAFREVLGLPQMRLVGHSFGGALATSYTITYPEDVSRLLLIAPAIKAGEMYPEVLKRLAIALGLVDLASNLPKLQALADQQESRSIYDPSAVHESVWQRRLQEFEQARANSGVLKALAFQKMDEELYKIQQPVLIVWGDDDPVLPAAHAAAIAEAIPNSEVLVWDHCGHLPFLEKQEQFWSAARAFLAGDPGGKSDIEE